MSTPSSSLAFAGLFFATWFANAQTLLNVDFGGSAASSRSGPAGIGLRSNDFWNGYSHYLPRYAPGLAPIASSHIAGLKYADSGPSAISIAVTNAPSVWGNATGDAMLDSYIFAPNGSNVNVTISGLDAGRYHLYIYGHAEADVSPQQSSIFTLRIDGTHPSRLGPLTSAGAAGWKSGQPWLEGRQYVLFRDVAVTTGESIVVEAAPGPGGVAVLNGLQILSLGTGPPRQLTTTTTLPVYATVTNLIFREISYTGVLGSDDARFKVMVEVESRSTDALSAVFFDGELALQSLHLPAGWQIANSGRQFILTASIPGSHRLEFDLVAKVTRAEPWHQISFTGPPAAIANVSVQAATPDTKIQLTRGTVLEGVATNLAIVRGVLDPDQRLELRWQGKVAEITRDTIVAVDTQVSSRITPSMIRHTTTLRYDVLQGRIGRVRLKLPADQAVTRVRGDAVRDWQITPDNDSQLLTVEFLGPQEATTTLTLLTEQSITSLPGVFALAAAQPLDVQREGGAFRLIAEDVVARVEEAGGLRQVNTANGEFAAYRFDPRPASVRVSVARVEPVISVAAGVHATLEESRLLIRHDLAVNISRAGIYALNLSLPSGLTVSEVTGNGIEDWKVSGGRLDISFGQRVLGERKLAVLLEQPLTGTLAEIVLTPVRLMGATKETAFIGAKTVPGLNLKTTALEGAREIAVAGLPEPRNELLAYRADVGNWRVTLAAERLTPRLVAEVFNLITIGDGLVGGSATIRFAILNQGVPTFRVRLPKHWRNVEFTGPNLRRTDRQDDVWTLSLQDKAWGAYALVVTYDYAFDPMLAVLDATGAHPLDLEREDGSVAVTARPGLEVKATTVAEPLRVMDATELAPTDRALITRPVLLAFRYDGADFELKLNIVRHNQIAVRDAVTDRAQLTSVLTEHGEMLTQAAFMVKNKERQYQRFQLPPGATLWGVAVDGESVKAERDGDWVLISLPRDENRDQTFAVNLTYEQPMGRLDRLGGVFPRELEFVAPRTDVPGTYAEWELYTPPNKRIAGFDGNMTIARGTTYGFRDGWDEFVRVYQGLWHDFGMGLIVLSIISSFFASLYVLGRKGFGGVVQVLAVFAVLIILAGMLLPALAKAKAKAQRISSVSNLKQIGLAARQFALDHEGKMPTDLQELMYVLGGSAKVLVHPITGERYTWVGAGKSEENPQDILAFGSSVNGNREVLLADGSVQQATESSFTELLAAEAAAGRAPNARPTSPESRIDPLLAKRYGLAAAKVAAEATEKLAAAADQAAAKPVLAAEVSPTSRPSNLTGNATLNPTMASSRTTVTGLRSLKIEVPKLGRAWQFTRILNLGGEPPTIRVAVMSMNAFVFLRTTFQLVTFLLGLTVAWWQWRQPRPNTLWLTLGLGLALVATGNLFIAWRALHLVLIVSAPAALFLVLGWLTTRWLAAQRSLPPVPPGSPSPLTPMAGGAAVLLLVAVFAPSPLAAESSRGPNLVSLVSANWTGTTHEQVAQLQANLEFTSSGTNQAFNLFGKDVAVHKFVATTGDARLQREGENISLLLPLPGAVSIQLSLLVKLGGDGRRRILDIGLPPALSTQLDLTVDEPDAEVEFPGTVAWRRTAGVTGTKIDAVLGATDRLVLAWRPRIKSVIDNAVTVFGEQASLVTFGAGVVAVRSVLDFTAPQGEMRVVHIGLPTGQRVVRVGGDLVREWDYANANRAELVVGLLKPAAKARVVVETESILEQMPVTAEVKLPHPVGVKRVTGLVAIRSDDELGLMVGRADRLDRIESEEFGAAFDDKRANVARAWRFQRNDFSLVVNAAILTPKIEAVVRNKISVGIEQIAINTQLDYAITRAGVFTLRLARPPNTRVESVVCEAMQGWNEATDGSTEIELTLKRRTLGTLAVAVSLTRTLTNLPPMLDLAGVHPLGVDKTTGNVAVSAEPGVGLKTSSLRGLTAIPVTALPELTGKGGVLAFRLLPTDSGPATAWSLQLATDTVESWVRAEVAASVTVGETLVNGRAIVRYDIQNAPTKEFRLRFPAIWRNVEIDGLGIRRRDKTSGSTNAEWRVELQSKVHGEYRLQVRWDHARTGTNDLSAAGVEVLGLERETGTVAFFTKGQIQLVPRATGEEVLRIDARELPAWAAVENQSSPVLSYRYLRPGWRVALEVKRYNDAALLQALVERVRLHTVVADDGQMMTRLALNVRNNGRQHLEIALPAGAEVWSAFVDGEPIRPTQNGGKLLLPLAGSRDGDAAISLELTYVGAATFPRTTGKVALESPQFDVPLKDASWEIFLPPDYAYYRFGGTMANEPTSLVPVSQDFTLASYRRQELEKATELESQAREFIDQTRKQVAEGNYDNAGKLSLFRSRSRQNVAANEELTALEVTVNRGQNSNFVQAQLAYARNNSRQPGGTASFTNRVADVEIEDPEVAARQVMQLNRAQQVAASRVTPLRVNLPTRGIRHVFTQVLQTEVNKPLTVTFQAKNERRTGWLKLGLEWSGAFVALWVAALVATQFRPAPPE